MFPANGENVKLGKGSLFLAPLNADGSHRGFERVGNVSSMSLNSETQQAEIFSSTQAAAPLLKRNTTRTAYGLSATCNEFTIENLRKWLQGETASKVQAALAAQTFTQENVRAGALVDTGKRRLTAVTLFRDGTIELVENVDYIASHEFGAYQLIKPADGGAVIDGDDVTVQFDQPALTITQVRIAKQAAPECALLFLSDDANTDGAAHHDRLECWKVSLAPEGELNLISDEYGSFQLTMAVQDDSSNHPADPYGTLDRIEA
jgi:hypothetical protein